MTISGSSEFFFSFSFVVSVDPYPSLLQLSATEQKPQAMRRVELGGGSAAAQGCSSLSEFQFF